MREYPRLIIMKHKPLQMKSSKSKQPSPPNNEVMPQFACALYIEEGKQKMTWNIAGNFPKKLILPGLLTVAHDVKLNLLDKIVPGDDNDRMYELLKEKVEKQAEDDTISPESEPVLKLHTLPTKEKV